MSPTQRTKVPSTTWSLLQLPWEALSLLWHAIQWVINVYSSLIWIKPYPTRSKNTSTLSHMSLAYTNRLFANVSWDKVKQWVHRHLCDKEEFSLKLLSSALFLMLSAHTLHSWRYQSSFSYLQMEPNTFVHCGNYLPQTWNLTEQSIFVCFASVCKLLLFWCLSSCRMR